jgi:hypothetical protein
MTETTLMHRPGSTNGGEEFDWKTLKAIVTAGDLSRLDDEQQTQYYLWRCEAAGLDPKGHPFQFIELNRRLVFYATKAATDQLCDRRRLTVSIVSREVVGDLCIVTARAADPTGRYTEDIGVVTVAGLEREALANALMKCVTKAKRRAVLSLCGLGTMDESEIPDAGGGSAFSPAQAAPRVDVATGEVLAEEPETPEEELSRTMRHIFAAARKAGLDTEDREGMRRVAAAALRRPVPYLHELDAADRATVAYWVRDDFERAVQASLPPEPEPEAEESEEPQAEELEAETQRELRLGTVQALETTAHYSGLIQ